MQLIISIAKLNYDLPTTRSNLFHSCRLCFYFFCSGPVSGQRASNSLLRFDCHHYFNFMHVYLHTGLVLHRYFRTFVKGFIRKRSLASSSKTFSFVFTGHTRFDHLSVPMLFVSFQKFLIGFLLIVYYSLIVYDLSVVQFYFLTKLISCIK